MKSAFELAMERLGGNIKQYSNEQKEQLADIGKLYDAKIAQAKFAAADRLKKAGNDPPNKNKSKTTSPSKCALSKNAATTKKKNCASSSTTDHDPTAATPTHAYPGRIDHVC